MKNNESNVNGLIHALKGLFDGMGIRLGYSQSGKALRYVEPVELGRGHLLLIAPARVSRRVPLLLPCLLEFPVDNAESSKSDATGHSYDE